MAVFCGLRLSAALFSLLPVSIPEAPPGGYLEDRLEEQWAGAAPTSSSSSFGAGPGAGRPPWIVGSSFASGIIDNPSQYRWDWLDGWVAGGPEKPGRVATWVGGSPRASRVLEAGGGWLGWFVLGLGGARVVWGGVAPRGGSGWPLAGGWCRPAAAAMVGWRRPLFQLGGGWDAGYDFGCWGARFCARGRGRMTGGPHGQMPAQATPAAAVA